MQIQLNGELKDIGNLQRLSELVETLDINLRNVAIEQNQVIIPKSQLEQTAIQPNDRIEIVEFIGGG